MLVLASASPRRAELLRRIGLDFTQRAVKIDETPPPGVPPEEAVTFIAAKKAEAAARPDVQGRAASGEFILAADTAVILGDEWLGQPRDADHARGMLRRLSGRTHRVLTGVAVRAPRGQVLRTVVESSVTFRPLEDREIEAYVATGEPLGKAGAYAIQGAGSAFVQSYEGDYSNIVGLPMRRTLELLQQAGYPLRANLRPS